MGLMARKRAMLIAGLSAAAFCAMVSVTNAKDFKLEEATIEDIHVAMRDGKLTPGAWPRCTSSESKPMTRRDPP